MAGAFTDAVNAAEEVYYALQGIRREREPRPEDEYPSRQVHAFEKDREKIQEARERFADAQIRFEGALSPR
jgi:hypothetical protein